MSKQYNREELLAMVQAVATGCISRGDTYTKNGIINIACSLIDLMDEKIGCDIEKKMSVKKISEKSRSKAKSSVYTGFGEPW